MKFWDSSAVVALLIDEPAHRPARALLESDASMVAWWATPIECVSAIARREREQHMAPSEASAAISQLQALSRQWSEVLATDAVRNIAQRILRVHTLRAADSQQLAAAIVAAEGEPQTLEFVSLDGRLNEAALKEGFPVTVPE
jgi:predicted nucleic acid-binding protein